MDLSDIPIGGDYDLKANGLSADADDTPLNAATVTYTMYDADGAAVSGGTGSLSYVSGTDGNYLGVVQSTVTSTLTHGARYRFHVVVSQSDYNDARHLWARARRRGST